MDEGTLEFMARHKLWTGVYKTRVRENDEISKFITFATILSKEIDRKIPDFLEEFGVENQVVNKAVDSVGMVLDTSLLKKIKETVKPVPRGLRKTVSAYLLRNAMIVKKVPFLYDPSSLKTDLKTNDSGSLKFAGKHKLWNKTIAVDIDGGDELKKFVEFAAAVDAEVMLKMPLFFKELGIDISEFDGMVDSIAAEINDSLPKSVNDTLPFVSTELRGLCAAYAVRISLSKNKFPYDFVKGKIKPLLKKL